MNRFFNWLTILTLSLATLLTSGPTPVQVTPEAESDPVPVSQPATVRHNVGGTGTLRISGVTLSPGYDQEADPGAVVTYTHTLTNTGNLTDTFVLEVASAQGWPVTLLNSAYTTGTLTTLRLPVLLEAGLTTTLQVSLSVPTQMMSGTVNIIGGAVDNTVITATSQADPTVYASVTDTTTVRSSGSTTQTLFLPFVAKNCNQHPPVQFGVGFGFLTTDPGVLEHDLPLVKAMGVTWVRLDLRWEEIEPLPGQYNWESYDVVHQRLVEVGLEPLPIVHVPPDWAAEGKACGPISDTLAFERFLQAAIERYGPDVNAWEFVNEPDGKPGHTYGRHIGCWGFRPEDYARQLEIFYTQVKALDPDALVVFGGLAYDNWPIFERSFFEKTLQNGAGQFFDVANLHYYPVNLNEFPTMAHKINVIRDIMTQNGVWGKRIWVTETGMWVNDVGDIPIISGSLEKQRDFIVRGLVQGFGAGADHISWYAVREKEEQTLHRWLINFQHEPVNGYYTFQHLANKLENATYVQRFPHVHPDVEVHQFTTPEGPLYIMWSNTVSQTVQMPASTNATLTDRDGESFSIIPVEDGQVTFEIGTQPMFLEFVPPETP